MVYYLLNLSKRRFINYTPSGIIFAVRLVRCCDCGSDEMKPWSLLDEIMALFLRGFGKGLFQARHCSPWNLIRILEGHRTLCVKTIESFDIFISAVFRIKLEFRHRNIVVLFMSINDSQDCVLDIFQTFHVKFWGESSRRKGIGLQGPSIHFINRNFDLKRREQGTQSC